MLPSINKATLEGQGACGYSCHWNYKAFPHIAFNNDMIRYQYVGQRLTYLFEHTSSVKYVPKKMFLTLPLSQFPSPIPSYLLLHLTFQTCCYLQHSRLNLGQQSMNVYAKVETPKLLP